MNMLNEMMMEFDAGFITMYTNTQYTYEYNAQCQKSSDKNDLMKIANIYLLNVFRFQYKFCILLLFTLTMAFI